MRSSTEDLARAAGRAGVFGNHDMFVYRGADGKIWTTRASGLSDGGAKIDQTGELTTVGGTVYADVVRGDDPKAEALVRESSVSGLIDMWATTSNDSDAEALAMQRAARDEFGLTAAAPWSGEQSIASQVDASYERSGGVYRDFLRTQYDTTQASLKAEGITEVPLSRGFTWADSEGNATPPPDWANKQGEVTISSRPLSSWTSDLGTAQSFAGGAGYEGKGNTINAVIAADQILSYPRTGIGCLKESEFVVLGGSQSGFTQHAGSGWTTLTAAAHDSDRPSVDDRNEDWLRTRSWDLPKTVEGCAQAGIDLEKLVALPAGEAMPAALRALIAGGQYDEGKHPRGPGGKFAPKDDGADAPFDRNAAVQQLRASAERAEPATSRDLQDITGAHGAQLAGFDFRLKSADSLDRKIQGDAVDKAIPEKAASDGIADTLRYTATLDADNYAAGVQAMAADLRDRGYDFAKVKNTWDPPDSPYRGLNTQVTTPEGYRFELQFHTPESFDLKNVANHHDYEEFRKLDDQTSDRGRELWDQMAARSEALAEPSGAADITTL